MRHKLYRHFQQIRMGKFRIVCEPVSVYNKDTKYKDEHIFEYPAEPDTHTHTHILLHYSQAIAKFITH